MAIPTYEEAWQQVLDTVSEAGIFKKDTMKNWISKTQLYKIEDSVAYVVYRTTIIKSLVAKANAIPVFEEILSEIWGEEVTVVLKPYKEMEKLMPAQEVTRRTYKLLAPKINPEFTFENFVEGGSNKEAYAACLTCCYPNKRRINPVMIYGNSGLGKTHLMHAIGNYLAKNYPEKKVFYAYSGDLVSILLDAMKTRDVYGSMVDQVKQQLIECDYFLIDDIQNLQQSSSQEVFFTVYNELVAKGAQVVLTSDMHPEELNGLHARLISRFRQGYVIKVGKPEFDTARAILRKKLEVNGEVLQLTDETIDYLAEKFSDDVRSLEGSLNRLLFSATLENPEVIDLEYASRVFSDEPVVIKKDKITLKDIKKAVTRFYGISYRELEGSSRIKKLTVARHMFVYLSREMINAPYSTISQELCRKDHTTAINSYKKAKALISKDDVFKLAVDKIKDTI
ncbi:MAG: chromosomal replication initiator protein DnaA [Bacillota bacterium]|nr:chromosomal replication initiator protein DnaA [Bacillota bacterium]